MRLTVCMAAALGLTARSSALAETSPPRLNINVHCAQNLPDHTACIREWVAAGVAENRELYVSNGTWRYSGTTTLVSNLRLVCDGGRFRSIGADALFLTAFTAGVENVHIEGCRFDVYGGTANFLAVIAINPTPAQRSRNIELRNNRFHDSKLSGRMSAAQRQYIALLDCENCRIIDNQLNDGGRIKVGRPGTDLVIRGNRVNHANDNAITVVDVGAGISERITIEDNIIRNPKNLGIFFGADGETQTNAALTTKVVLVRNNHIEGDWQTACILGTLPYVASGITVTGNTCRKTGRCPAVGIAIKRTNLAEGQPENPAQTISIQSNIVSTSLNLARGEIAPLSDGGIFFSGTHDGVVVTGNSITKVGSRAIRFAASAIVTNATITNNTITWGNVAIEGSVTGTTAPNTIIAAETQGSRGSVASVAKLP